MIFYLNRLDLGKSSEIDTNIFYTVKFKIYIFWAETVKEFSGKKWLKFSEVCGKIPFFPFGNIAEVFKIRLVETEYKTFENKEITYE